MPGPADVQITIAQQTSLSYQQQLHQQQPLVQGEHQLSADKAKSQREETAVQSLEKGAQGIKIEEKRGTRRFVKKRKKKEEKEEEKKEKVSNGIRGKIIDVIG